MVYFYTIFQLTYTIIFGNETVYFTHLPSSSHRIHSVKMPFLPIRPSNRQYELFSKNKHGTLFLHSEFFLMRVIEQTSRYHWTKCKWTVGWAQVSKTDQRLLDDSWDYSRLMLCACGVSPFISAFTWLRTQKPQNTLRRQSLQNSPGIPFVSRMISRPFAIR